MRRVSIVVAGLVALVALVGCEPAMTITAKSADGPEPACTAAFHIVGTVTPHNATGAVQLQQTFGGKWKDVSGYGSMADWAWQAYKAPTPRRAAVNQSTGAYTINYYVPAQSPIHLRVRSNGGGAVSNAFYVVHEFC